jgi:hypothetical protein
MKLAGASAITRIALNPECGRQVSMLRSGLSEPEYYQRLTGEPYPDEYGERLSARRRGAKFERNAYANYAAQLRDALSEIVGVPAAQIWVRNMGDEEPGLREANRIRRWRLTMRILADQVAGRPCPQILIQPQLHITADGLIEKPGFWIAPDILFLERTRNIYRPADLKSFVVRGNKVERADLERSRLQVAIQSLALHESLRTVGDSRTLNHIGGFIFATPYGLSPHKPQLEALDGSVDRVQKALIALRRHGEYLDALKKADGGAPEHLMLDSVPMHFQERCMKSCALARLCQQHHEGKAHELGDAAVELLGPETDLDRAFALMSGAKPKTEREREIAAALKNLNASFAAIPRAA